MSCLPEEQSDDCHVICPYCGNKYQAESEDFSENEREEECHKCGKTYLLHSEFYVTHYTRGKPEETEP